MLPKTEDGLLPAHHPLRNIYQPFRIFSVLLKIKINRYAENIINFTRKTLQLIAKHMAIRDLRAHLTNPEVWS